MALQAAVLAALVLLSSACAQAHTRHHARDVRVDIVDEHGVVFEQFPATKRGHARRAYLQAERGARYRIRVHNAGGERVGVVIAVDGRNIISGARSELAASEPMYVLAPWTRQEYSGWRTSLEDVHEFYFTDWEDSYAEAFGDRSAKGVIAVAVYRERPRLLQTPELASEQRSRDAAAPAAKSEPGTGYGERRHEPATRVAFDAEPRSSSRVLLKYEWRETLCAKRIIDCARDGEPNRLWDERDEGFAFAPPPPRSR